MEDSDVTKKHKLSPIFSLEDGTTIPLQEMVKITDPVRRKAIKDELSDTGWFPVEEIMPHLWQILDGTANLRSMKEKTSKPNDRFFFSVLKELEKIIHTFLPSGITNNEKVYVEQRAKILPMLRLYTTLRVHVCDKSDENLKPNRILEDSVEISEALVKIAIEHGANVNETIELSDDTPLSRSANTEDPEVKKGVVKTLLSHGARMFQNVAWNGYSFTPALMYHFTMTHFDDLEAVMDIFQFNSGCSDEFYKELPDGSSWVQSWLRELGRLVEKRKKAVKPLPLPDFCEKKLDFLIAKGSDINSMTWDEPPLIIAATLDKEYPVLAVTDLLDHGASNDVRGMFGASVLHNPRLSSSTIYEVCHNYGGNVNSVDFFGWTPAMYTLLNFDVMPDFSSLTGKKCQKSTVEAKKQCIEHLKLLLDFGTDPTMRDRDGACLIHHAAARDACILETILKYIDLSDINVQDKHKDTPLHYAAHANNIKCIELLLVCGAEKEARNSLQKTALDIAQGLGFIDALDLLSNSSKHLDTPHPVRSSGNTHFTCLSSEEWNEKVLKKIESAEFESACNSVFDSPFLGCNFFKEAEEVRAEVKTFMENMAAKFNLRYPEYAFSTLIRGSSAEGTKVGFPDEFDFMLMMKSIEDKSIYAPPKQGLRVKILDKLEHLPLGHLVRFGRSDKTKFCQTKLTTDLGIRLMNVFNDPNLWQNTPLRYCDMKQMIVGFDVTLMWNGACYKNLLISVDFVASFPIDPEPIPMIYSWPRPIVFSGCDIFNIVYFLGSPKLSTTHSMMEEALIKSLPEAARQAYMLSKAIRSPHVFPFYSRTDSKETMFTLHEHFTSYSLKNILLKEYCDAIWAGENIDKFSRYDWVKRVYKRIFQQWARKKGEDFVEIMCGNERVAFKFYFEEVYKYFD